MPLPDDLEANSLLAEQKGGDNSPPLSVSELSGALKRTVEVRGLSDKRGPAPVAAALYEETPESIRAREQDALERRLARPPGADLGARPTKLDRRRLEALRRANRQRRPR